MHEYIISETKDLNKEIKRLMLIPWYGNFFKVEKFSFNINPLVIEYI